MCCPSLFALNSSICACHLASQPVPCHTVLNMPFPMSTPRSPASNVKLLAKRWYIPNFPSNRPTPMPLSSSVVLRQQPISFSLPRTLTTHSLRITRYRRTPRPNTPWRRTIIRRLSQMRMSTSTTRAFAMLFMARQMRQTDIRWASHRTRPQKVATPCPAVRVVT